MKRSHNREVSGEELARRKGLFFVLAAVLAVGGLVGCGSDESGEPRATLSESSPASETSDSPTEDTDDSLLDPNPFGGDESWIAYQSSRTGMGVWLIHPDGTEDHQISFGLPDGKLPQLPDWSPDGTSLVITSRGDFTSPDPVFEYDLATGTSRELFECELPCLGDDEPVYSPDGTQVAFIRALAPIKNDLPSDCSLWIGDVATTKVHRVTHNTKTACDREYNPRWSPDGTQLTYWRQPSMDGKSSITAVFVMSAEGTGERRLTDPAMEAGESVWSRDGEWITFATHPLAQFDSGESHLYRMHPDGTGLEKLTDFSSAELRATQPQYTPDGRWIVFTAVTPTTRSLWAIPANGGNPVEIAADGIYTHGTWQPTS